MMSCKNTLLLTLALLVFLNITGINEISAEEFENKTIIAVIDSKINTQHENIKYNCLKGKTFILGESNETGHGTSVAGAVLKYSEITAKQLWNKKNNIVILPIEINVVDIQTDYGYILGEAIQYAVDQGAKIINMSFSCSISNKYVYEKIRYGIEKGVIFVSAAGNSGYNIYSFPAAYDGVISVGSYSSNLDGEYIRSSFSNSNDDVDLLMPGEKMLLPDENLGYSEKTGTSYSAGAFSGIIGSFINKYPNLKPDYIVFALFDTASPIKNDGGGFGVINVIKANEYLDLLNNTGISSLSYNSTQSLKLNDTEIMVKPKISAGRSHIAHMEKNEILIDGNRSSNRSAVLKWKDVTEIYAGSDNTAAINSNKLPLATGYNVFNKNIFRGWTDIKNLTLSSNFTAGLTEDGEIYVTDYLKQAELNDWKDITQISSGAHHLCGLTKSGKVLTVGYNIYGQMDTIYWKDIIFIASNTRNTVGLDKFGKVTVAGDNLYGQCNLDDWNNIISVDVGDGFIVGLKSNGTVVAKGRDIYEVCHVEDLTDIIFIDAADTYFIAVDKKNNVFIKGKSR